MDYLQEAEKLADNGQFIEANELLEIALEKDPKFIGAYINKGANYSAMGNYKKAIQTYYQGLLIDPGNTMLLFNIGNNYRLLENYETAIEFYNKAFETKGGDKFYVNYDKSFDFADIGQYYDIEGKEIYFQRGLAYLDLDSIHQSYSDFNNCIKRNYEVPASLYYIGFIYLKNYQDSLGCENLKKSASLGYKDALIALKDYCK